MDGLEIYVLCERRSSKLAFHFLDEFLPQRTAVATEYPYPEFDDNPRAVFTNEKELFTQLEREPYESYATYWDSTLDKGPRQAMLFFTTDGAMISGLGGPDTTADDALVHMASVVGGRFGYVSADSCPPDNQVEFIEVCRASALVNLFEGHLRNPGKSITGGQN